MTKSEIRRLSLLDPSVLAERVITLRKRLEAAEKVLSFSRSLLSEEIMRNEANCFAVYPMYLDALAAYDKLGGGG